MEPGQFTPLDNLLMNLMSGLRVEDLVEDEITLLEAAFGPRWKVVLGYDKGAK